MNLKAFPRGQGHETREASRMEDIREKYENLLAALREMGRVLVAFSGGVDSTFLLKAALDALDRDHVLAVTADSETYPARERTEAIQVARQLGARHEIMETSELDIPGYVENPSNRCFFVSEICSITSGTWRPGGDFPTSSSAPLRTT
ncbi:protein of unknown function DUF224 cysteine-rich region domain protein [Alicyclobacillus acidocaldarius subsp. acidocaldarius Tc-4-1]|uniref:NAD/GMP synthase domain-containing protein n=1 Tax=Alicyclobacillus acidocaldarius (strain Tc-4-1) TaxID=1048834 RepID=F8IEN3_ALIAT|nr:protein of unknown function DUF224 cysteine-rich region domain protein [Alicyclobacillus acidocaldarius subsp. acidocaldarius Tc-4-1]